MLWHQVTVTSNEEKKEHKAGWRKANKKFPYFGELFSLSIQTLIKVPEVSLQELKAP